MRDIELEACAWAMRSDEGSLDATAQAELAAWLAADVRHRGAFLRAQAGLVLIDEARHAPAADEPAKDEQKPEPPVRTGRWRGIVGLASAACAASLAVFMLLVPPEGQYETAVGELRHLPLQDGSLAVINTDSVVQVDLEPEHRQIYLEKGEAWFQVAKDRDRPFTVSVDGVHVRATGTAFSVRRREEAIQVIVTEGSVEAWNEEDPSHRLAIAANQEATVPLKAKAAPPATRPANEEALAWRQGDIVLEGMSVVEAAEEFNRYNRRKIIVRSPVARDLRIIGYFRTNQPELFAEAVAREVGIGLRRVGDHIVI